MQRSFAGSLRIASAVALFLLIVAIADAQSQPAPAIAAKPPRLVMRLGESYPLGAIAFSPDGKLIAAGGYDGLRLWDARTGQEVGSFATGPSSGCSLVFTLDGKRLLVSNWNAPTQIIDVTSGKEVGHIGAANDGLKRVTFSPDGKEILTAGNSAILWDAATGKEIRRIEAEYRESINSAAFSPDGKQILTGSDWYQQHDGSARLWDAASGKEIRRVGDYHEPVKVVAFSPDGKQIAIGIDDSLSNMPAQDCPPATLRLLDIASGKTIHRLELCASLVRSAAFSRDGKRILTGGGSVLRGSPLVAQLWDVASGKEIRRFEAVGEDGGDAMFTRDDENILTSGASAILWDATDGREIRHFAATRDPAGRVAFSAMGKQMLIGGAETAQLWNADGAKQVRRFGGSVWAAAMAEIAPSGNAVLLIGPFKRDAPRLLDAASGTERWHSALTPHEARTVVFSPDSKRILIGTDGGPQGPRAPKPGSAKLPPGYEYVFGVRSDQPAAPLCELLDAASGAQICRFDGHTGDIASAAFSPDGKRLVTGGYDNTIRFWDASNGRESRRLAQKCVPALVALSQDGKQLVAVFWPPKEGEKCSVCRWDAESGKEIRHFDLPSKGDSSVALASDGKHVLALDSDTVAHILDTTNGAEIGHLKGNIPVASYTFSPDGKFIAAGSDLRRLWDAASGDELCTFASFTNGDWVVVDPEGRFDAPHGGNVAGLTWFVDNQLADPKQMIANYYDPGLLAKKMGFDRKPLREIDRSNGAVEIK